MLAGSWHSGLMTVQAEAGQSDIEQTAAEQAISTPALLRRLRNRQELQLAAALSKADRPMAAGWWTLLLLRGLLPATFSIATGVLVGAIQHHYSLAAPLVIAGVVFILLQITGPLHTALSANLGDRTAAWLYD